VAEALLPRKIGGVPLVEDSGPVLPRHEAGTAFHPGGFAGQDLRPDIGGMMEDLQHAEWGNGPQQRSLPWRFPPRRGETEVLGGELCDDGQGGPRLGQEGEAEADRLLDFLVGSEDHLACRIEHEPRWRPEAQRPGVGLFSLPPSRRRRSQGRSASLMVPWKPSSTRALSWPGS
jgi:hypothetical protein